MRWRSIRAAHVALEGFDLLKRILVAVVFVPVIFLVLYAAPPIAISIAVAILSGIAVYEALCATDFLKHSRIAAYSILLAVVIPFWVYYDGRPLPALCGLFLYVLLLFCEAIGSHKQVGLEKMGGAFFLSVVIPFFLSSFLRIRHMAGWEFYVLLPFVAAFMSDACALFAGMLFGRHKLAPDLSPKKTVEGAVGGLVGAVLGMLIYGLVARGLFHMAGLQFPILVIYGLLGSILSQLGDLSFSYIKREYGIKDFGNILPGHGGILDRFDSVIFCAPLIELLIHLLPVVK